MTDSDMNPEIIKKTQESLGKFVKKPPLTEKLLRKPPFKFIHDVVKVVRLKLERILKPSSVMYRSNRKIDLVSIEGEFIIVFHR